VTRSSGAPHARRAFLSALIKDRSDAELRALVEGDDPVSDRPFMAQVLEQLTSPLALPEAPVDRSTPRLLEPDSEENLRALFEENHWTDYLPIVLPTEERVAEMLTGTSHDPDEVIGKMRPANMREAWELTVEKVAVNAVMAGALPEYLPVLLAVASNVSLPADAGPSELAEFRRTSMARISSITSMAAMTIVNGPIRNEMGMNCGIGALGPYNRANATIGRGFGLLTQNLQGGSVAGISYMGTMGSPFAYNSTCFAENEERSPWTPLHVRRGFNRDDSVVTVGCAMTLGRLYEIGEHWEETLAKLIRAEAGATGGGGATVVVDPDAARVLAAKGGPASAEEMVDWMIENAGTLRAELVRDTLHWGMSQVPKADAGIEPYASWAKVPDGEMVPLWGREQFEVVVTGGETVPSINVFGEGSQRRSSSIDEWR
jgi:hypothetical protein